MVSQINSAQLASKKGQIGSILTRPEGLEPSTSGFGDRRSTN